MRRCTKAQEIINNTVRTRWNPRWVAECNGTIKKKTWCVSEARRSTGLIKRRRVALFSVAHSALDQLQCSCVEALRLHPIDINDYLSLNNNVIRSTTNGTGCTDNHRQWSLTPPKYERLLASSSYEEAHSKDKQWRWNNTLTTIVTQKNADLNGSKTKWNLTLLTPRTGNRMYRNRGCVHISKHFVVVGGFAGE